MDVLIIFVVIPGLVIWGLVKFSNWYGPKVLNKRRDEQIETAIRMGMRDAEAEQRIARRIIDEQNGR